MAANELIGTLSTACRRGARVRLETSAGMIEGLVWSIDRRHTKTVWLVGPAGAEPLDTFVPLAAILEVVAVDHAATTDRQLKAG